MLKNLNYNLISALAIKSRGLARYDKCIEDAAECPSCQEIWKKIKQTDEELVSLLRDEIKKHLEASKFD